MFQRIIRISLAALILITTTAVVSQACVGRLLYIGALETTESKTMAEMLVILINERTGTDVKIRYFADRDEIYQAFQAEDYPLLPRILTKLSGAIDDATFTDLIGRVNSGEKAKNVTKDFLKVRKFI
ncbi:MAG: hypothetical protein LC633_02050 [Desulfobulbaceae bacterium]|nr:hypothetical protein [Desulfobulbaceae bacterium]